MSDVDMTFEGRPISLGARLVSVIGVLFAGAAKKALHQDLVNLKRVCEAVLSGSADDAGSHAWAAMTSHDGGPTMKTRQPL